MIKLLSYHPLWHGYNNSTWCFCPQTGIKFPTKWQRVPGTMRILLDRIPYFFFWNHLCFKWKEQRVVKQKQSVLLYKRSGIISLTPYLDTLITLVIQYKCVKDGWQIVWNKHKTRVWLRWWNRFVIYGITNDWKRLLVTMIKSILIHWIRFPNRIRIQIFFTGLDVECQCSSRRLGRRTTTRR